MIATREEDGLDTEIRLGAYTSLGYHSAREAEREGRSAGQASAGATHDRMHREKTIAQSRSFLRNDGLYRGIQRVHRQLVHGSGFTLNVRPADGQDASEELKAWCRGVEADFNAWWKKPDVRRRLSGRRLAGLVCNETFAAGDVGVVLVEEGSEDYLQVVEAEQIKSLEQDDGIQKDEYGRPLAFFVSPYDSRGGALQIHKAKGYKPEQFLLVGDQDRASSSRAVPPLQASFPNLFRLNDIANSAAINWQMQARVALIVNREAGAPMPGSGNDDDPRKTGRTDTDGDLATKVQNLDYALIFHGKPNEKVSGMERSAPGRSYREDFAGIARPLGLPIGLPLELILLDFTPDNYSQTRALIALCNDAFLERQLLLEEGFYQPVAEWRIRRRIALGKMKPAPGEYVVEWIKPAFPWIDLLVETQAWGERVQRGFSSYTEAVKSQNRDPEAIRAQQARDVVAAIETAAAIEKAHPGVKVPWEIFCGLQSPGQTARAEQVKQGGGEKPKPEKPKPEGEKKTDDDEKPADAPARKEAA